MAVLVEVDGAAVGLPLGVVGEELGDAVGVGGGDGAAEGVVAVGLEGDLGGALDEGGFEGAASEVLLGACPWAGGGAGGGGELSPALLAVGGVGRGGDITYRVLG